MERSREWTLATHLVRFRDGIPFDPDADTDVLLADDVAYAMEILDVIDQS